MRPLLLIQTGEAPETIRARFGGIVDWFRAALTVEPADLRVVRVDQYQPLPPPREIAEAVITGSAAMVTDHSDWSENTAAWIHAALDNATPMFGVCYGHQLIAQALRGTVGWLPAEREIGTEIITRYTSGPVKSEVLGDLPVSFAAQTTHRQTVLEPPPGAEVLACSISDPYQLLRYAPHTLAPS